MDLVDDGTGTADSSVTVTRSKFFEAWSTLQREDDDVDDDHVVDCSAKVAAATAAGMSIWWNRVGLWEDTAVEKQNKRKKSSMKNER